ncbi:MAG TPA: LysM domain-containing protein [Nakamurella sp.]|jgi:hypothetical protein
MFVRGSRYDGIETATVDMPAPDGSTRQVCYVRRRFLPPVDAHTTLVEHRVAAGERLDVVTARYVGDPLQFWRLCDANDVLRPESLEVAGLVIAIAMKTR